MNLLCLRFVVPVLLVSTLASLASGQDGLPITVINYTTLPVHGTAISLETAGLCRQLGLPPDTPLRVRRTDQPGDVLLTHGVEDGRAVVRLYVSLPAASRLELTAERADRWADAAVAVAQPDELQNGVLRFTLGKQGWRLGFGQDQATLIENGGLDFWIDAQNRGRITNADVSYLKQLGLSRFIDAPVDTCTASVAADGRPAIHRVRRMAGVAQSLTVIETFELVPGLPILIYRIQWQNDGDAPLWVAYVGSGNGVYGKWSKELLPRPLVERKKSPLQGDINGSETRCAWLGGLCRISMESPATGCGVGLSTLLPTPGKVGQGSMIWGCSGSGFQCNLIDPAQGQFPFLVKPHESLDNGIALLATQTGVSAFRQTVELWQQLQKERLPRLAPPCAVFVGGQPVYAQTVTSLDRHTERQAALRLDFHKHYELRVTVTGNGAAQVSARPLATGKPAITLLETSQPGTHTIDLNERLGWVDEVPFVLETSAGVESSLTQTLPVAPTLLSPVADAALTDWAAMFRWQAIPLVLDYDLQWSQSADFSQPREVRVASSLDFPWYLVPDDQLPAPGPWYWHIRGVQGQVLGPWSPVRRFTVNDEHGTKPLRRPLTPAAPLFTLEATRVLDYTQFQPDVPADIAPYVGIVAEGFEAKGLPVTDFARGLERLPHAILLRSHWVGLADIEWLCQHVPNFVGIQGGEHLSSLYRDSPDGEMRYHHRLTRICAKYGLLYQEADGTYKDDKWQDLMDKQGEFIREYGRYLVLSQKNNIIRRQFYSQSAALGLWLGGITYQHGAWEDGGFYWQNAGFNGLGVCQGERSGVLSTMPRIFWDLVCVMGLSRGCGLYSLDGQTLMISAKAAARDPNAAWPSAIWYDTGKTTDTFQRFVVPLIRGVIQHQLVPTREDVLRNIKLAVYNDRQAQGDQRAWPQYAEYGPLYAGTYGFRQLGNIDGQLWEFFPNTGRYHFIPVLPQGNQSLAPGIRNLPVSELQDVARVQQIFQAAYPPWYDGEALVCRAGDTITVLNSRENEDVTESYSLPLGGNGWCLSGQIGPHAYVVGKLEDRGQRLWLQTNAEYPERETTLYLTGPRKPTWLVTPPAAVKFAAWDEGTQRLTLRLAQDQGAVEVTVQ